MQRLMPVRNLGRWVSVWLAVLLAVAIHVDWHMARHGHDSLSLGWRYHWLFAIPVFAVAGWYAVRRWPAGPLRPAGLSIALGAFLGQVVEPFGEIVFLGQSAEGAFGVQRLVPFLLFMAVGVVTCWVVLRVRLSSGGQSSST